MKLKIFTVDAFAEKPFSGNPAAVVPLEKLLPEATLQDMAKEMNLSETAYVCLLKDNVDMNCEEPWVNDKRFLLRWFTPTNEVALCGHATLATAHVIFNHLGNKHEQIEFETKSGILVARKSAHNIILDFPSNLPDELDTDQAPGMACLAKSTVQDLAIKELRISHSAKKLMVCLEDSCTRKELESLRPDAAVLLGLHDGTIVKGVIVTLRGQLCLEEENNTGQETEFHVLSRYFAPWNGIPEDPVTGSAHTVLGPYWSKQLRRTTLKCRQCSPRGGNVDVTVRTDGRVELSGCAVTVIQGFITT